MSQRKIKINTNSKSNRIHTPEYLAKNGRKKTYQLLNKQKKIINKNQKINSYKDKDLFSDGNIDEQLLDISNSIMDQNNILSLNKKIISQQNDISYLKLRLKNYENTINEISRLNKELSKMKEAIKVKNGIILEFQELSELTKAKFENYINVNDLQINKYENKYENLPEIQNENNNLNQKLISLQNENKKLQEIYKEIELKNKKDLDKAKEDLNNIKKNSENLEEENSHIKNENIENNREIEKLRQKLLTHEKNGLELDKINKKYSELENQITEKNNKIKNLEKMNQNIEDKIKTSEENYKNALKVQNNIKEKLKQLEDLCNQYEFTFQKIKKFNKKNTPQNLRLINRNNVNYDNNSLKEKQTKKRVYYNHNKRKIDNGKKIKTFNDENLSLNYYHLIKNNEESKGYIINNEYKKNQKLDLFTQKCSKINQNNNINNNINNNKINYIKNSNRILDKSFGYSNYLLDNLKNKISEMNFDYKF